MFLFSFYCCEVSCNPLRDQIKISTLKLFCPTAATHFHLECKTNFFERRLISPLTGGSRVDLVLQFSVSPEHMCGGEGAQRWNNSEMSTPLTRTSESGGQRDAHVPGRSHGRQHRRAARSRRTHGRRKSTAPAKCSQVLQTINSVI